MDCTRTECIRTTIVLPYHDTVDSVMFMTIYLHGFYSFDSQTHLHLLLLLEIIFEIQLNKSYLFFFLQKTNIKST